ncbi:MAG TPA: hypothetical protein V6C91_02955 [Coleofasciculaceae cyanobacterium]
MRKWHRYAEGQRSLFKKADGRRQTADGRRQTAVSTGLSAGYKITL